MFYYNRCNNLIIIYRGKWVSNYRLLGKNENLILDDKLRLKKILTTHITQTGYSVCFRLRYRLENCTSSPFVELKGR